MCESAESAGPVWRRRIRATMPGLFADSIEAAIDPLPFVLDPGLSQHMYEAFRDAGGTAEFHMLPPFAHGHLLINSGAAFVLWAPILEKFLAPHP